MKKICFPVIFLIISQLLHAQPGSFEALFDKYSEKKGFTSVYVSGKMLNLLGAMNREPDKADNYQRGIPFQGQRRIFIQNLAGFWTRQNMKSL